MGETDDLISKKANILLSNDIKPIICVGEKERDSDSTHLGFISQQISKSLFLIDTRHISSIIIAYEPIWAVGAPEPMKTTEICETTIFIKKILSENIIIVELFCYTLQTIRRYCNFRVNTNIGPLGFVITALS
jgi:triosephosphate isomerase